MVVVSINCQQIHLYKYVLKEVHEYSEFNCEFCDDETNDNVIHDNCYRRRKMVVSFFNSNAKIYIYTFFSFFLKRAYIFSFGSNQFFVHLFLLSSAPFCLGV